MLADIIELAVAFEEEHSSILTRGQVLQSVSSNNRTEDDSEFLSGDEVDDRNTPIDSALKIIEKRASWLGDAYPFALIEEDEVRFVGSTPSGRYLPYLFLLICSNGDYAPSIKNKLRLLFEDLCKEAFRELFPNWAEVLSFSQYSEDRRAIFGRSARDAVCTLANKLNSTPTSLERLSNSPREFGIDIIAICPFGDESPYPFYAFAQCTVAQTWWDKRHEAIASSALTGFIPLNAAHSNFLMIPHFPRIKFDEWSEDPGRTGNCILCDRYRICRLLQRSGTFNVNAMPGELQEMFQMIECSLIS